MNVAARTQQIKNLLSELNQTLKMSVQKAIEIGRLLSEQKNELEHGQFLPWLESNFEMSERFAQDCIRFYKHKEKTAKLADLQAARDCVQQIEWQEKKQQEEEDNRKIYEFKKTGKKPDGWERRHDYLYKKALDDNEYEKRKAQAFQEKKKADDNFKASIQDSDEIIDRLTGLREQASEDRELKETLKLNSRRENVSQEVMFETIDDYLNEISDVSRRIETAQNLIKYIRNKVVQFQVKN